MANNYSRQRETVYQVLSSTHSHPSADWIYARCKQLMPRISLGTVYRNLELLVEQGKAVKIAVAQDKDRYDACVVPHSHFVCSVCGKVEDCVPSDKIEDALVGECDRRGFDRYSLMFFGVCDECKRTEQSEQN